MTATSIRTARGLEFLVYPCNLLGYIRLGLVAAVVAFWHGSTHGTFTTKLIFVAVLCASSLLDALDGYVARRLHHETHFGRVLDQSTDLITSTVIWLASGSVLAVPILILEWSTGVSAMAREALSRPILHWLRRLFLANARWWGKSRWGESLGHASHRNVTRGNVHRFGSWFARRYFANRQRNTLSIVANVSHFSYPMALILGPEFHWAIFLAAPGLVAFVVATVLILVGTSGESGVRARP